MPESRPEDALGSLVETVETVETVEIEETEETEDLKKYESLTYLLTHSVSVTT